MRRTTAASGLDGWGTQHNTTVLSLIRNTDAEQQPTLIDITCCVCYEQEPVSERRADRGLHGGLKREGESWGWGSGTVLTRYCLKRQTSLNSHLFGAAHTDSTGLGHKLLKYFSWCEPAWVFGTKCYTQQKHLKALKDDTVFNKCACL